MPKISVIIPLYNKEKFICDTIYCLRAQTFKNFECIVVDDSSTDQSLKNAEQAIDGDTRFYIVKNKVNSHASATRNIGLLYASGDYIVFLDADDVLTSTCLTERYTVAVRHRYKNIAGSYSKHKAIAEDERVYPSSTRMTHNIVSFQSCLGDCPVVMHSPLIRRDIACGVGGFDERLKLGAEDFDFWVRVLRHGFIFLPTHTVNAFYREEKNSMVRLGAHNHLKVAISIFQKFNAKVKLNSFFSIAAMKMFLPAWAYALEAKIANRIFRFVGMHLEIYERNTAKDFVSFVPNCHNNFPFDVRIFDLIRYGIVRRNPDLRKNKAALKEYDGLIMSCISDFIDEARQLENVNIPTDIENVDVYSAEWQRTVDIAFIPHKDYHAATIELLQDDLKKKDLSFVVVDCSALYRDEGVRSALHKGSMPHVSLAQLCFGDFSPKCVVVFNDWDRIVTRPAMEAAKKAGIVAMAIVEGVQDYDDADTGRIRHAYKTCSHVIAPSPFDMKYFDSTKQQVYEGSIPRIAKLAEESESHPYSRHSPIVINSNFSYNVLVNKRDAWVTDAVDACTELGLSYVISRHPADMGDFSSYVVTEKSMYDAIWNGSIFISRFGSGIIESLAMNRPVIYFNPHGERVDKFKNPIGAYYIAHSKEELKAMIQKTYENINILKTKWPAFLELHAGYSACNPHGAIHRVVEALHESLTSIDMPKQEDRKKFGQYFSGSFHADDANLFRNVKFIKDWQKSSIKR